MTELRELLERFSDVGTPRDPDAVFDNAYARAKTRRRQRRVRRVTLAVVVVAALGVTSVIAITRAGPNTHLTTGPSTATTTPSTTASTEPGEVTAAQLAGGTWSVTPAAPIPGRSGASVVWTGHELLVWGGVSGKRGDELHADGAAYNPSTGVWRVLSPSPLSARQGQAAVWTGHEFVIWGGYDDVRDGHLHATANGAAYSPSTNTWQMLPAAPLSPRVYALAVWTGSEVLLLGGRPANGTASLSNYADAATYDPATQRWQHVAPPETANNDPVSWAAALAIGGHRALAWSLWSKRRFISAQSSTSGGVDLFTYDADTNSWTTAAQSPDNVAGETEGIWTGIYALVRGGPATCDGCLQPVMGFENTARYDPATNQWTTLATDPQFEGSLDSAWTGHALFSLAPTGNADVYDPTTDRWTRLRRAPIACDLGSATVWTGKEVLTYCPPGYPNAADPARGLVYTQRNTNH
ncbi:MAG: Kelch repeat-containing protein [Acidimicrobiia bacterium]